MFQQVTHVFLYFSFLLFEIGFYCTKAPPVSYAVHLIKRNKWIVYLQTHCSFKRLEFNGLALETIPVYLLSPRALGKSIAKLYKLSLVMIFQYILRLKSKVVT
uniref:Putative secreted protein n=1 Tax=Ixodes ricinus TaxID=34613 RepID=A0A6B0U7P1_IXORI